MKTIDRIQVPTEAPIFNEPKAVEAGVRLIMASGGRQTLVKMLAMESRRVALGCEMSPAIFRSTKPATSSFYAIPSGSRAAECASSWFGKAL